MASACWAGAWAALQAEGGERLATLIREQFPVALIDEFQDTGGAILFDGKNIIKKPSHGRHWPGPWRRRVDGACGQGRAGAGQ